MSPRGPGGRGGHPRPRPARGMVTVELAVGIVTTVVLTGCLVSMAMLGVAQSACAESSAQLARLAARGDDATLAKARARAPEGARISLEREPGGVSAQVRLDVAILGLGEVEVGAGAWAAYEPGQGP